MDDSDQSEHGLDVPPQGWDILAGLSSLGISQALCNKVQSALEELAQHTDGLPAESGAADVAAQEQKQGGTAVPRGQTRSRPADLNSLQAQLQDAEQKLHMSRSIMRKLYYKNVNLEKELAVVKVRRCGCMALAMQACTTAMFHAVICPRVTGLLALDAHACTSDGRCVLTVLVCPVYTPVHACTLV
jgi:hypothetical protein